MLYTVGSVKTVNPIYDEATVPEISSSCTGMDCHSDSKISEAKIRGNNDGQILTPLLKSLGDGVLGNYSVNVNDSVFERPNTQSDNKTMWIYVGCGSGGGLLLIIIFVTVLAFMMRNRAELQKQETFDENPDYGDDYCDDNDNVTQVVDENDYYYSYI